MRRIMRRPKPGERLRYGNDVMEDLYRDRPWFFAGLALLTAWTTGQLVFGLGLETLFYAIGVGSVLILAQRVVVWYQGHFALTAITMNTGLIGFASYHLSQNYDPRLITMSILAVMTVVAADVINYVRAVRRAPTTPTAGPALA